MISTELQHFAGLELHQEDFEKYLPEIHFGSGTLLDACKHYQQNCVEIIQSIHDKNYHSEHIVGLRSRMVDRLIQFLFEECERESARKSRYHGTQATIMAIGGYGREEMNVYSDVDLLFLYSSKKGSYIERLTERVLYVLWDLGLDVGYATRTIAECKKLFFEDMTIMTSLLDARYLAGDHDTSNRLVLEIRQLLKSSAVQKKLVANKVEEKMNRIQKYGGSVFVLEPNVKECAGTLRDLQLPLWIAKIQGMGQSYKDLCESGLLDNEELELIHVARNFLWRIRNELHLMSGKKVDLLTFQRQEMVAVKLGFKNADNGILAVEQFMQTYYRLAFDVYAITDRLIRDMLPDNSGISRLIKRIKSRSLDSDFKISEGHLAVKNSDIFVKDPIKLLNLFKHVQDFNIPISPRTKDLVMLATRSINDDFRKNKRGIKLFRDMMNHYQNLGAVLFAMHETQFLDSYLPEFKKLRCRVQHDMYHIYTIDTHSIFAVNELSKLYAGDYDSEFSSYAKILAEVRHPEMLTMGLLLHDIGKGEGGNHSVKGAVIAESITDRLGYSDEEKKTIDFLIQSHLMMPHISQRRDLDDPDLIVKFARSMESTDKLNMLALLTWGDIRAVGPEAWTEWKGILLQKLYDRSVEIIEKGDFSPEKIKESIDQIKIGLITKLKTEVKESDIQSYLSLMPGRYFFACGVDEVAVHIKMNLMINPDRPVVSQATIIPDQRMASIEIVAVHTPQILSHVTGLMLAYGMSILRANAFQMKNGYILLSLLITDGRGEAPDVSHLAKRCEDDLKGVLTGKLFVSQLIEKRQVPTYLQKKPVQKAESKVVVDNDVSAYSTVIEVYTHDRLGLLFDIIRTLNELGCYVEVSKISTKVEQVSDIFYVKDIFGHKIVGGEKIRSIKRGLMEVLEGSNVIP